MEITFGKWGNSLATRIPADLAKELGLADGMKAEMRVVDGQLLIVPRVERVALADLIARIDPEDYEGEVETGGPVGNEAW